MRNAVNWIVVVHRGNTRWLGRALRAAKVTNPRAKVILIGDDAGMVVAAELGVHFASWDAHARKAEKLAKVYLHRSSHGEDFELVCLQRWMVLESWMKEYSASGVVAIDSDIILFSELGPVLENIECPGVGVVYDSAHLAWIQEVRQLSSVCNFIFDAYLDPAHTFVETMYQRHITDYSNGGVSDMTFFQHLMNTHPGSVNCIHGPHGKRNWMFDVTLNDGIGGFELVDGTKQLRWLDGIPHAFHLATQEWFPFASLHFQGDAKKWMPKFFGKISAFRDAAIQRNDRRLFIERLKHKVQRLRGRG